MGTLTIRNLNDNTKRRLRERGASHSVSMEEEARRILREAIAPAIASNSDNRWRLKASLEEILAFGRQPDHPTDLKTLTDEMWDEGLR